jgi:hypothetical protein
MYQDNKLIDPEKLQNLIDNIFSSETMEIINSWSAEVQNLLVPRDIEYFYGSVQEGTRIESEFSIRLNKHLSNSEILNLLIISYYLPFETQFCLQEGIRNIEKQKQLHKNFSYRIISSGISYCYLYLLHSKQTTRSFNGQIRQMIKQIQNDVNSIKSFKKSRIFQSFWFTPESKVTKYTGYTRHYKDHGSLRPDIYYLQNHRDDEFYQKELLKIIKERENCFNDTLSIFLGFIE